MFSSLISCPRASPSRTILPSPRRRIVCLLSINATHPLVPGLVLGDEIAIAYGEANVARVPKKSIDVYTEGTLVVSWLGTTLLRRALSLSTSRPIERLSLVGIGGIWLDESDMKVSSSSDQYWSTSSKLEVPSSHVALLLEPALLPSLGMPAASPLSRQVTTAGALMYANSSETLFAGATCPIASSYGMMALEAEDEVSTSTW